MTRSKVQASSSRLVKISQTQKQNIKTLLTDIKNSIDAPLSQTSLKTLRADLKNAVSDRTISKDEFKTITSDVIDIAESAGITATEARKIFYDLQNIAEASRLPRTNDTLTGTSGGDVLWGGLGKDMLTGADATNAGVGEIDLLIGGGGQDTFVLGTATIGFYDDGKSVTAGLQDYALIADFNPAQDTIQLKGSASDYTASALPAELGLTGTGIYKVGSGTPELIGVVLGGNISSFSSGFTFV